jgi:tRNA1Val (adenine37-N6)-methyltransferase
VFHFKKFSIDDSSAEMKIGTDAVILGAWAICENESRILDIGTGTGILALMMAQRNLNTAIDAVELENKAAELAENNVTLSPWSEQIQVFNSSLQEFSLHTHYRYSLVICNPPFFAYSLKSPVETRNLARHNDSLPVTELLQITSKVLLENGNAAFILPADAYNFWQEEAAKLLLYPVRKTFVRSSPAHKPHRILVLFAKEKIPDIIETNLIIYVSQNKYSQDYKELTKEFYLHF